MTALAPAPSLPAPTIEKLREGPWLQLGYPDGFEWNRITLPTPGLPPALAKLRILHLTDLHLRPGWGASYDELIHRVKADPPDLILYTGDLIDHHYDPRPAYKTAQRLVSSLPSHHGSFAILGNHDGDMLGPAVDAWGLRLIDGSTRQLTINGAIVDLIGLPASRHDLTENFLHHIPPKLPGSLRVVLSHYPDFVRRIDTLHADVVLAGHTHGGQLCFPNGFPLMTHDSLPKSMCQGVHRTHNVWLVIGRGFGFSTWPIRLFCPAEVIEVRFAGV